MICPSLQKRYLAQSIYIVFALICLLMLPSSPSYADHTDKLPLPVALFAEKNWSACRLECRRILITDPTNNIIRLLCASAGARSSDGITEDLDQLIKNKGISMVIRHAAGMELARLLLKKGSITAAFEHFVTVFIETDSSGMFKQSGYSLSVLIKQNRELTNSHAYLKPQLKSCSSLWTPALIAECSQENVPDKSSWSGKPAEWIISFYQAQIAPAIGERCSLSPSCSAYAIQALRKHGALGLAIYADRAVREPDVIQNSKNPVIIGKRRKYRDTLDEHDYWMASP
ncbi:MAG: membrane protein insertion efficiency factor YidD [Kiritimatiellae bacterium]|nr:membrane protein insertion efficiency factor YidD [Kiritimatiellia bacterium]